MCILPGEKPQCWHLPSSWEDQLQERCGGSGKQTALPRSQLGGVQDAVFALPLNERLGVPLGLTPQQGCVALVHSRALWLHLEGDENWMGRAQEGVGSSKPWGWKGVGCPPPAQGLPAPAPRPCHGHTCHGKLDVGTDLALQPIGGNASVVAGVITGHLGEVQGPGVVCHPLWEAAAICGGDEGKLQA